MRVITVGTSEITKEMIKAFKLAGVTVHACVSRALERARDFASANGVKFYLSDYDKALTSENYDTVYIALPNSLHFEYAKKALEAGKHVIVEKPFCSNYKEASELYELAKTKGLYVFENMTVVHNPIVKLIKQDLELIGPIRYVEMNFYKRSRQYTDYLSGKLPPKFDKKFSGGSLMIMNVYNVALTLELFGIPDSLSYHPYLVNDIDMSGCAVLNYKKLTATLNSGINAHSKNFVCISGEKGFIYINDASSRFNNYDVFVEGRKSKRRKVNIDDFLSKNIRDFEYVISTGDFSKYNEYVKASLNEMKVLDSLRKSGKVIFD